MDAGSKIEDVLQRLKHVRKSGSGWKAKCPAHDDRQPSLSVANGDDGRVLLRCFAGCTIDAICAAVNLTPADLFKPSTPSTSTKPRQSGNNQGFRRQDNGKPKGKAFPTANDAVKAIDKIMAKKKGQRVDKWIYTNIQGDPIAVVVRYDLPTPDGEKQKKEFRPVSQHDDGWHICDPTSKWPLYRLRDLVATDRIYIVEGEKCVELARSIGLNATTSAHGCGSPHLTDWQPVVGRECAILPDVGGTKYVDSVAAILAKLDPSPATKMVELPGLKDEGDDIEQFIIVRREDGSTDEQIRAEIEVLADEAEPIQPDRPKARIERFQPFPTDALPNVVRGFVAACAKAIGCDPSYAVLPLLSSLAASIGNSCVLMLKRGWTAPAILWTMCVGESGSQKTPPYRIVVSPLRSLQQHALQEHSSMLERYEIEKLEYESALTKWKRKPAGDPPEKPSPPATPRIVVSDTTVEALAVVLQDNPQGVLLARDELAGWIGSFDKYAKGRGGSDVSHWLSMYNGETMTVDRKTGQRLIVVPNASVSITGGIQPSVLKCAIAGELRDNGLAARILMAYPPQRVKRWVDSDIPPEQLAAVELVFDRLRELEPATDSSGDLEPAVVRMLPDARARFIEYYNEHAKEQSELSGDLASVWSKIEEAAARLALVHHLTRWACGEVVDPGLLDVDSMDAGIVMARWFANESRRIYSILDESDDDRVQRRLIEWIERKGGSVTVPQVQRGHRQYHTAQEAEADLDKLAKAGFGDWHDIPPGPKGGRPSREFRLPTSSMSTKPSKTRDSEGFVDIDSVDIPETQFDNDWGEL